MSIEVVQHKQMEWKTCMMSTMLREKKKCMMNIMIIPRHWRTCMMSSMTMTTIISQVMKVKDKEVMYFTTVITLANMFMNLS